MAVKREKVSIPAKEEMRQVAVICDSCGKQSKQYDSWGNDCYDIEEVKIQYKSGANYPEGGSGDKTVIDLCPDCFQTKLIPAMEAIGIHARKEGWDW